MGPASRERFERQLEPEMRAGHGAIDASADRSCSTKGCQSCRDVALLDRAKQTLLAGRPYVTEPIGSLLPVNVLPEGSSAT